MIFEKQSWRQFKAWWVNKCRFTPWFILMLLIRCENRMSSIELCLVLLGNHFIKLKLVGIEMLIIDLSFKPQKMYVIIIHLLNVFKFFKNILI